MKKTNYRVKGNNMRPLYKMTLRMVIDDIKCDEPDAILLISSIETGSLLYGDINKIFDVLCPYLSQCLVSYIFIGDDAYAIKIIL